MISDLTVASGLFLLAVSFFAGFVDSIAGGGGLVQLPALLIGLPKLETAQILGINKLSSVFGTLTAAKQYSKQIKLDSKLLVSMCVPAFIGSAAGALLASKISTNNMRPMILVMLIIVAVYTWFKPEVGKYENLKHHSNRRNQICILVGIVIGFYDGIFGPGTGSFLILILVVLLGYTFITASAIAKVVNVSTNIAAIMVFGLHGVVLWQIGLLMGVANITGALFGSHLAIEGGSQLVRKVFLVVTVILILKLGIATF